MSKTINEQLLQQCGDKIEVLYQRRRMVSAETARLRLREELTLISGTETEQQLLTASQVACTCRRKGWPIWEAGVGPCSIILFLLGLSQTDPVENGLPFQRFFSPDRGELSQLLLKTLDPYVQPLEQLLTATAAKSWARVGPTTPLETIPYQMEEHLRNQGKAPDWGREPTDWPIIWTLCDSELAQQYSEHIHQFHRTEVFQAWETWQPGSLAQFAAITASAHQASIEGVDLFTWSQREGTTSELFQPWVRDTGGVLVFQEQIMTALHELAGFDFATAWQLVLELGKHKTSAIDRFEKQFIEGAIERGHDYGNAWTAFDNLRHAGMRGLHCKAYHAAHAVTTYRALWMRVRYSPLYNEFISRLIDP
jgi:DNA polymerase III alpha subunit